ncbi:FAD-binding domain-containing protein [Mycena rosella]|uniref:FAD-binding domain-containing protein n=1 Tax=Mycena rosella TaxID=1033263 RepID=A0AAD7G2A6_MYCRO|nr:FAD-binding domain-containing protein [Mycena rosella]
MSFTQLSVPSPILAAPSGFYNPLPNVTTTALDSLFTAVDGRLFPGVPLAYPCFADGGNGTDCITIQNQYTNETYRTDNFAAFINTQWETCQSTGAQCLLNADDPSDSSVTMPPVQCRPGSVSGYFIDVRDANDVAAAFNFSEQTGVPLVIKNTGHDYKGRSSAPNSLALWMHNLKQMSYNPEFVPEGCSFKEPAATLGAGVQWAEAYEFADKNNITLVGGSDRSVGVIGGWLQGGGHSVLSNTMGLGVDRVLQFKVVTPDGKLRVANACQNEDLFFALRGGGGSTFGLVLEATMLASPPVTLQAVIVSWSALNRTATAEMWKILAENALAFAADGWGGFSMAQISILVTPVLDPVQAASSMAPIIEFGRRLQQDGVDGAQLVVTTFPSFLSFFEAFTEEHVAVVGTNIALTSRLVPKSNVQTPGNISALVTGFLETDAAAPGMIILLVAPVSYVAQGGTSVTDAWRSSLYHVTAVAPWAWNATATEKRAGYQFASRAMDNLRNITPDAAYSNEADVYEPNYQVSFWGSHYERLLQVKQTYDPRHLLDCWQCVGWDAKSPRFSCYL